MAVSQPKRAIKPFQGFHAIKNDSLPSPFSSPSNHTLPSFIIIIITVFDIPISTKVEPHRQPLPILFHHPHRDTPTLSLPAYLLAVI
jgi:hypothetical protein